MTGAPQDEPIEVAQTRAWVDCMVIGLNLCPFARAPQVKGRIRYALCKATQPDALRAALVEELIQLASTPIDTVETTLLIHPRVLTDFAQYNAFLSQAESALDELGLVGSIQIASFHPHYRFANTSARDVTNATNRSPYPMLHLIREASIDRALAAFPNAETIYMTNLATMRRLGHDGIAALQAQCNRSQPNRSQPD